MTLREPPLTPEPAEAEQLLREELDGGSYAGTSVLEALRDWLQGFFEAGSGAADGASQVQTVMSWLSALVLLGVVVYLLTRVRASRAAATGRGRSLFGEEVVSAAVLRARAEAALAQGRFADAVVDGYRALALRQIEDDQVDDVPGATAQEVGRMLAGAFPAEAAEVRGSAALFDAVLYGGRDAVAEQAAAVLRLDDRLPGRVRR